jgi:hypothetical protein
MMLIRTQHPGGVALDHVGGGHLGCLGPAARWAPILLAALRLEERSAGVRRGCHDAGRDGQLGEARAAGEVRLADGMPPARGHECLVPETRGRVVSAAALGGGGQRADRPTSIAGPRAGLRR